MRRFGLIGNPIQHSFSQKYFAEKFLNENIPNTRYDLYPLESIHNFRVWLEGQPEIEGLNVTIPYKESIIPHLDELDFAIQSIGAVNVIKKIKNGKWKGFNTDYYGFMESLQTLGDSIFWRGKTALIFGSGGGSKAVQATCQSLQISYVIVSRSDKNHFLSYDSLRASHIQGADVLINTTPVGMWPNVLDSLPIPYEAINENHIAIDLIYNPTQTIFLKNASQKGARTLNGLRMLTVQAEMTWEIWNRD